MIYFLLLIDVIKLKTKSHQFLLLFEHLLLESLLIDMLELERIERDELGLNLLEQRLDLPLASLLLRLVRVGFERVEARLARARHQQRRHAGAVAHRQHVLERAELRRPNADIVQLVRQIDLRVLHVFDVLFLFLVL